MSFGKADGDNFWVEGMKIVHGPSHRDMHGKHIDDPRMVEACETPRVAFERHVRERMNLDEGASSFTEKMRYLLDHGIDFRTKKVTKFSPEKYNQYRVMLERPAKEARMLATVVYSDISVLLSATDAVEFRLLHG